MVQGKLDSSCKRMKLASSLTPLPKLTQNRLNVNVRAKTIKLLEENISEKLHDSGFGNNFWDITAQAQSTKEKTDNLDYIKIKSFCRSKETINRVLKGSPLNDSKCLQITCLIRH